MIETADRPLNVYPFFSRQMVMRTVANADKIVVLDDGKISEMGTPQELMKKNGLYAHLVNLQRGK